MKESIKDLLEHSIDLLMWCKNFDRSAKVNKGGQKKSDGQYEGRTRDLGVISATL